ncbi:MAG: hypothetical protein NTZ78_11750 [Candidatus Aureabacteria bacterium]|nr:hypothetical protein [Candidatus Auribacterota bacterium]
MNKSGTVSFACSAFEWNYTQGKVLSFLKSLESQLSCGVQVLTDIEEIKESAVRAGFESRLIPQHADGKAMPDRLKEARDSLGDLNVPGSDLPMWKVMVYDRLPWLLWHDIYDSTHDLRFGSLITPINPCSCFYSALLKEARKQKAVAVGVQFAEIKSRYLFGLAALYDYYLVKSGGEREFLISNKIAPGGNILVMDREERYLISPFQDPLYDSWREKQYKIRGDMGLGEDNLVVVIPFHPRYEWELRSMMRSIGEMPNDTICVIIKCQRQRIGTLYEKEELCKIYSSEMKKIRNIKIIEEELSVAETIFLADALLSPCFSDFVEYAAHYGRQIAIFDPWRTVAGDASGVQVMDAPGQIEGVIEAWQRDKMKERRRLRDLIL